MLISIYHSNLQFVKGDILNSKCKVLTNTTNELGVMGKGLALKFKNKYPEMYSEYRQLCKEGRHKIGTLHLWKSTNLILDSQYKWILNFPTKTTYNTSSKIEYIEKGLQTFVSTYRELKITSIAFPALGCGLGGLDWNEVKLLMEKYLQPLSDLIIEVYEPI